MHTETQPRDLLIERFLEVQQTGDLERAREVLAEIVPELQANEEDFAQLCYVLFDRRETAAYPQILERFCSLYPASLHAVQAFLAVMWAEADRFDEATAEARYYLSKVRTAGVLSQLEKSVIVQHAVGHAFLAATAAYTRLGWISYSLRILEMSLRECVHLIPEHRARLEREREMLARDLLLEENSSTDGRWEDFYRSGQSAAQLIEQCVPQRFQDMALRVGLLESEIQSGKAVTFDSEFFKSVYGKIEDGKTTYFLI